MINGLFYKTLKDGYIESSVGYNNKVESIDHRVIIFVHASLLCTVTYFSCNDNSLFTLLTSFAFLSLKNLNKD